MPDQPHVAPGRDKRLDMFRGLALVMIFINHVPGTVWEKFTNRNFGFSDAAEGFVLMSGIAAGLAYSKGLHRANWAGARRIWRRSWTLYLVHLLTTAWAIAISAAFALWFAAPQLLHENQVWVLFQKPLGFLIGVPALTHQLGYTNILPLYAVLLLATPLLIIGALRWPRILLAGSILFWIVTGQFRLNLPNFPNPGGWFFNPLAWQVIFVFGLLTGVAMKQGRRFVPILPWLQALAAGYLILALLWLKVPVIKETMNHFMWILNRQVGLPFYITAFDKTFASLPRLLHVLALAYLLSTLVWVRRVSASSWAEPFALLGRHALQVFATGTILCFVLQGVKDVAGNRFLLDTFLLSAGLSIQFCVAWLADRWKGHGRPHPDSDPLSRSSGISSQGALQTQEKPLAAAMPLR
ncbi:OpgC family protein [Cereibacter azotoformans]|uniref:OpgC family protein n=1 Tax=Cereibacter azotoformans TaxID=43057 RepID=UPI000C6DFC56|nr:OpgC domain-containing protein [Cereibacter azotoformans]